MMADMDLMFEVAVAGSIKPTVYVRAGVSWCGTITDGISIDGFVMSFRDLERIYTVAKAFRDSPVGQARIAENEQKLASVTR